MTYVNQQNPPNNNDGDNNPPDQSDKYDSHVMDESDILNDRDLNINPQVYIHTAINRSQMALLNPNLEAGLTQYVFLINQIEMVTRSARLLNEDDYKKSIDEFKNTEEYKSEKRALYQHVLLAGEKLRLLLRDLFDNRTSSAPLKL